MLSGSVLKVNFKESLMSLLLFLNDKVKPCDKQSFSNQINHIDHREWSCMHTYSI